MDVEAEVESHLNSSGIGVPALCSVPPDRPKAFVSVERTGGAAPNAVQDRALLSVVCWHASRPKAERLCRDVERALLAMPDEVPDVFRVSVGGVSRAFDAGTGMRAYRIVCEVSVDR